ncbi:MAG: flagellar hook-length control protein FliK [Burkholderiaceae bacterium]|nr:flagellar hook-length control protein FliK [Burkholderiaceae bacterium]
MTPVSNAAHAAPQKSAAPPGAARDGENSFGALMGKLAQHADEPAQLPERHDTDHASASDAPSTAKRPDAAACAKPAAPAANATQAASGSSNTSTAPTTPTAPTTLATAAAVAAAARAAAADGKAPADATAAPDTDAASASSAQTLSATAGPDASTTAATPPGSGAAQPLTAPLTLPALIAMLMPAAALAPQAGAGDKALTAGTGGKAAPAAGASSAAGAALTAAGPPGAKSAAPGQDRADAALSAQTPPAAANLAGPALPKPDLSDAAASSTSRDKLTDAAALTSSAAPLAPPLQAATPTPDFNRLFTDAQAGVYQATLPSRPHEAAFAGDLSAEVKMLMDGGLQRAELRLNPSDLGPIQIQLSITDQTADISFHAAHSQTREGIEQAMPALREMLAAQGLSLGQAGVSSGQEQRQGGDAANTQAGAGARVGSDGRGGSGTGSSTASAPVQVRALRGMLDMYA